MFSVLTIAGFGFVSLLAAIAGVTFVWSGKHAAGVTAGLICVLSHALSARDWHWALVSSGKDPFFYGVLRYPGIAIPFAAIAAAGIGCILIGAIRMLKHPEEGTAQA